MHTKVNTLQAKVTTREREEVQSLNSSGSKSRVSKSRVRMSSRMLAGRPPRPPKKTTNKTKLYQLELAWFAKTGRHVAQQLQLRCKKDKVSEIEIQNLEQECEREGELSLGKRCVLIFLCHELVEVEKKTDFVRWHE